MGVIETEKMKRVFEFITSDHRGFRITLHEHEYIRSRWLASMVRSYNSGDPIVVSFNNDNIKVHHVMSILDACISNQKESLHTQQDRVMTALTKLFDLQ